MASKIWVYVDKNDPANINRLGKASFNEVQYNGDTPLLASIKKNAWEMYDAILEYGGDPFYQNKYGKTILGALIQAGEDVRASKLFNLYIEKGQKIPASVLTEAIDIKNDEWVNKLVAVDVEVDTTAHPKLPEHLLITEDDWQQFESDYGRPPGLIATANRSFAPTPYHMLDYAALGLSAERGEWLYQKGVCKLNEIPSDWLFVYQKIALTRKDLIQNKKIFDNRESFIPKNHMELWETHCFWEALRSHQLEFADHIRQNVTFDIVNTKKKTIQSSVNWSNESYTEERDLHPAFTLIYKISGLENTDPLTSRTPSSPEKKDEWLQKHTETLEKLFEWGLDPNLKECGWGMTLAHQAAQKGSKRVLELLSEKGADFTLKTGKQGRGKTVHGMLTHRKNFELASFVEGLLLKQKVGYNKLNKSTKMMGAL